MPVARSQEGNMAHLVCPLLHAKRHVVFVLCFPPTSLSFALSVRLLGATVDSSDVPPNENVGYHPVSLYIITH